MFDHFRGDPTLKSLEAFVEAAHELARDGVRAISTSCGFLAVYQKQIAAEISVPVFTSSLMQIPLVYRMLRPEQTVGVIAVDSRYLSEVILREVGADGVPAIIAHSRPIAVHGQSSVSLPQSNTRSDG